jgi:hypothetical protein
MAAPGTRCRKAARSPEWASAAASLDVPAVLAAPAHGEATGVFAELRSLVEPFDRLDASERAGLPRGHGPCR